MWAIFIKDNCQSVRKSRMFNHRGTLNMVMIDWSSWCKCSNNTVFLPSWKLFVSKSLQSTSNRINFSSNTPVFPLTSDRFAMENCPWTYGGSSLVPHIVFPRHCPFRESHILLFYQLMAIAIGTLWSNKGFCTDICSSWGYQHCVCHPRLTTINAACSDWAFFRPDKMGKGIFLLLIQYIWRASFTWLYGSSF